MSVSCSEFHKGKGKGKGKSHTRRSSVGAEADPVLISQPAGDSMHSHEPSGGLPPPPTRMLPPGPQRQACIVINPAVCCHYFPPGPQLPSQPSGISALRSQYQLIMLGDIGT